MAELFAERLNTILLVPNILSGSTGRGTEYANMPPPAFKDAFLAPEAMQYDLNRWRSTPLIVSRRSWWPSLRRRQGSRWRVEPFCSSATGRQPARDL